MQQSMKDGVVEVWVVDLSVDDDALTRARNYLSEDEIRRAERFRFPVDRRRFVIARSSLRQILSLYLKAGPTEFESGEYGKPRLSTSDIDVRFNVSRSGEKALIACTLGREVGIDIEWKHRKFDIDELASRFLTSEENEKLGKFPPDQKHQAFLRCWTCKEAFVKAVGKGLSMGLQEFDVSAGLGDPGADPSTPIERFMVNGCSVIPFTTSYLDDYVSALAAQGEDVSTIVQPWLRDQHS
jgi:4'-phosphopantetheinyl transferase